MDNRSDYEHSCPNHGPAYDCGVVQALRERIAELEDTCLSLETELASQVAANQILADMDAKTYAENQRLRAGLSEALDWNWLDDDAPDDSHLRALLGGGENG